MQTPFKAASSSWRRRWGYLSYPILVLLGGGLLLLILSMQGGSTFQAWHLVMAKTCVVLLTLFFLFLWTLLGSGLKKSYVIIGTLSLILLMMGVFRTRFDADMVPSLEPRQWIARLLGISHDDKLNRERQNQPQVVSVGVDLTEQPGDWPEYRGKGRTGVVSGPALSLDWENNPPKLLWKQLVGNGYAGFCVVNGHLITIEQRVVDNKDVEAVVCYEAKTGHEIWKCSWSGKFDETAGGPGPRATPTVFDGDVYALGALGRLVCIEGKTGQEKWAVETLQENRNLQWAMAGSPLVVGNLVIVNPGTQTEATLNRSVIAYDRKTGAEVWAAGRFPAGYSSPMLVTLKGKQQVLVFDGEGLGSYDPESGKELWRSSWPTQQGINAAQPLVIGEDQVFIASGYQMGGTLLKITEESGKWKASQVWKTKIDTMRCKFASPVVHQGNIYGLNDGRMECIDLAKGKRQWKDDDRSVRRGGAYGHGQILLWGEQILAITEYGEIVLLDASPSEQQERGRIKGIEGTRTWNNPALVDGILYLRNDHEMAAFDLKAER